MLISVVPTGIYTWIMLPQYNTNSAHVPIRKCGIAAFSVGSLRKGTPFLVKIILFYLGNIERHSRRNITVVTSPPSSLKKLSEEYRQNGVYAYSRQIFLKIVVKKIPSKETFPSISAGRISLKSANI